MVTQKFVYTINFIAEIRTMMDNILSNRQENFSFIIVGIHVQSKLWFLTGKII